MLTYVELFAGAGGLSLGLDRAGWECVAHAEIGPHARAVLRVQWPDVPLYGDVQYLDGHQFRGVDLVSGGSPCQDLSNAGRRAGIGGPRSSLFFEQVRIWRESEAPYFLWENVKGALTSNKGADFAAVLSTLVGDDVVVPRGGWPSGGVVAGRDAVAAWRVLDLQWFGPPQRRTRVFVVCARPGGVDPAAVLALGEGVCGHPAPLRDEGDSDTGRDRQRTALAFHLKQDPISDTVSPALGVTSGGMAVIGVDLAPTLGARDYKRPGNFHNGAIQSVVFLDGVPRKMTPVECERLMGWPDGWTAVGVDEDGDEYDLLDTPRYVLCGNGVGSPCAEWIGRRLRELELTTGGVEDYL